MSTHPSPATLHFPPSGLVHILCGQSVEPSPQIGSVTVHAACAAVHAERINTAERMAVALLFMVQSYFML